MLGDARDALGGAGRCWEVLGDAGDAGRCWEVSGVVGGSREVPGDAGGSWQVLEDAGGPGRCRELLGGPGRCWGVPGGAGLPAPQFCSLLAAFGSIGARSERDSALGWVPPAAPPAGCPLLLGSTQGSSHSALHPDKSKLTSLFLAGWKIREVFKPAGLDKHRLQRALYLILSFSLMTAAEGRGYRSGR